MVAQGIWVRRVTPRFPDAAGPIEGEIEGAAPIFNLIALGESTVAGIGAPTHAEALTGQTAKAYAARTGRSVKWTALGLSGADAKTARIELTPKLAGLKADAVIIALGINDAKGLNSASRWKADMRDLIASIIDRLGDVRITLAGMPPLDSFPAFPSLLKKFLGARSDALDRALIELGETLPNVVHVPMLEGLNESHFCEDRFHPSVAGYELWGAHLSEHL